MLSLVVELTHYQTGMHAGHFDFQDESCQLGGDEQNVQPQCVGCRYVYGQGRAV
jgi:hypothetical protein